MMLGVFKPLRSLNSNMVSIKIQNDENEKN